MTGIESAHQFHVVIQRALPGLHPIGLRPPNMHKLASFAAVRRFRAAAFLIFARCILVPASILVLIVAVTKYDTQLILAGFGMVLLTVLIVFLQWLISTRTQCPLCLTPVLAKKSCAKHRNARSVLGSHRLRVAIGVLFSGMFRCPYCNELTSIKVRERNLR